MSCEQGNSVGERVFDPLERHLRLYDRNYTSII